jgi:hypothetical protein
MNSPGPDFDSNLDKELQQMWQEEVFPQPAEPAQLARTIAVAVQQFDRKIFWRNLREYIAGGILLIVFLSSALVRNRIVPVPWIGVAAVAFVLGYLWWKHRELKPLDATADARAYKAALLARYDRQIQLLRSVRFWYFLPLYVWIVAATLASALHRPARMSPWAHLISLAAALGFVTALYIWLAWLNERHAVRRLAEAKEQARSLLSEQTEEE